MSVLRDKYQSVSQFFKDVKRAIEDIVTRLSDVETRIDEGVGGGALPQDEEEVEQETVDPFQYEGPFAITPIGTTACDITHDWDSGDIITPNSSGAYNAVVALVKDGGICIGSDVVYPSIASGSVESNALVVPDGYTVYLVNRYTDEPMHPTPIGSDVLHPQYNNYDYVVNNGIPLSHYDDLRQEKDQWIRLAKNSGGVMVQYQFGDINDMPQHHMPVLASSSYYADSATYHGHFAVKFTPIGGVTPHPDTDTVECCLVVDNDSYDEYSAGNIPRACGYIVQGTSRRLVLPSNVLSCTLTYNDTSNPSANVYLYKDGNDYKYKVFVCSNGAGSDGDGAATEFESTFHVRLANIYVNRNWITSGASGDVYHYSSSIIQLQHGDVVDVDIGGTTTYIDSRSYPTYVTSTYVDSRSYPTYVTSTYVDSRSYSSTIIMGGMDYNGAFKVAGGIDSSDPENPFLCSCTDGLGRARNVAGYVIAGNNRQAVNEPSVFPMVDGARVYLVGTPNLTNHTATYAISVTQNGNPPSVTGNQWYTELAYKSGGTLIQNQFGDVVAPYEVPAASNGGVQQILSGINTWVSPADGKGTVTINASSGYIPEPTPPTSSGGMMFPNYMNLADASPYGTSMYEGVQYTMGANGWIRFTCLGTTLVGACEFIHINNNAIGMYKGGGGGYTTFLPINSGAVVYYTGGVPCIVKFDGYATSNGTPTSSTI